MAMFEGVSRPGPRARRKGPARPIRMAVKRGLDAGFALLALIALCVPMALIVIVARPRVVTMSTGGQNGKQFGRFNFAFDAPAGRLLRETGLERLPELINVLKGDMSLVGPTPGSDGDLAARPGLVGPSEPSGPKPLSLLDDLSILVSIVLGRQG